MKRRTLLKQAGLLTAASLLPIGLHGLIAQNVSAATTNKKLIVIFLRGAVDGLNVVIPHQESEYYDARPTIAIAPPGESNGALDLDGYFGLNPALIDIIPLWKKNNLAFIHASGSPDPTRSHFEAQDYMEIGTPGSKNITDGWLNRLLATFPNGTPTQGINIGDTTPRIFTGKMPIASLPTGNSANRSLPVDNDLIGQAFSNLYNGKDPLSLAYQEGEKARKIILAEFDSEMMQASKGAPTPNNFAKSTSQLAKLMTGNAKTQVAFAALGGWDTHVNEKTQLTRYLKPLGEGLKALVEGLGSAYNDTVIVVMSEFGRTVKENGNGGTDHGHGNVMWVLGGGIRGGKVYGEWPTLAESKLFEKRDLDVTTDFREIISSVLTQHLQISKSDLAKILPGYLAKNNLSLMR